ncbi:MAG: 4-nitrophenylphosphatase, partial [Erysipelotrichaceae bacterium]|nr:4-nitrophenylphosphatase [Erysipelotrichaceae bacterium]
MIQKCYLIDLDGTMYWGTKVIPGAKEFINGLIKNKIKFVFLTNNASRTPEMCCEHMLKLGFSNITPNMFYTSAMAAAEYVRINYPEMKR